MVNEVKIINDFCVSAKLKVGINHYFKQCFLLIVFLIASNQTYSKENYYCNPKAITLCSKNGVASVSITGLGIAKIKDFKILKDGKETKDISVKIAKIDPEFKDIIELSFYVVNRNTLAGKYSLGWGFDINVVDFDLPITVINCPTNPKVDIIQNKYVQFEKYTESNIYSAIIANINPLKLKKYDFNKLLLNDPVVRRDLMLNAFAEEISSGTPKIRDWFPKTVGAMGGTLVLVGENMNMIREVKIGDKILTPVTVVEVQQQIFKPGVSRAVFELPKLPAQGDLTVMGISSNLKFTVEQGYKTVDQKGAEWPATRSTLISAVYATSGSSISSTMENGIGDAMRSIQYSYLIEYVPGNVLGSCTFKDSIPELLNKAGESVSALGAYGFVDASYNLGFFGNAILISFTKYIKNTNPTSNPTTLSIDFYINSESYQNTESAQNNIFRRTTGMSLKYNALKRYTIENTTQLNRIFDFQNSHAWGTVSGMSTNIDGSNPIEVGQIVVDNDIAFRIASGPFGTEASWFSSAFRMPQGWLVDKMIWSEKRDYSESEPNKMAFSGQENVTGFTSYMDFILAPFNGLFDGNCFGNSSHHYWPGSGQAGFSSCSGRWLSPQTIRLYSGTGEFNIPTVGSRCTTPCLQFSDCYPISIGLSVDQERKMTYFRGPCKVEPAIEMRESTSGQIVRGTVIILRSTGYSNNSLRVLQKIRQSRVFRSSRRKLQ
ncbi:MAG: hypothetical protein IPK10_16675 [Bacteroidetes bacterium]|nr:hypothetical protein [Bacteroidota bacterium]